MLTGRTNAPEGCVRRGRRNSNTGPQWKSRFAKGTFFLCPLLPISGRSGPGVAAADPLPSPVSLPPAQGGWHRAGAGSRGLASGGSLGLVGLARQLREVRKQWP